MFCLLVCCFHLRLCTEVFEFWIPMQMYQTEPECSIHQCDLQPNNGSFSSFTEFIGPWGFLELHEEEYTQALTLCKCQLKVSDISASEQGVSKKSGSCSTPESRSLHCFLPGALSQAEGQEWEAFCQNLIYLLSNKGSRTQVIVQYVKCLPSKYEDLSLVPLDA